MFFLKLQWTVSFIDMLVAMNSEFDGSHYRQHHAGCVEMCRGWHNQLPNWDMGEV